MKLQFVILSVLFTKSIAVPAIEVLPSTRIVGGRPVDISQYPYQASVVYFQIFATSLCGGSIVSANVVVTAAHCSIGTLPQFFVVRVASNDYQGGGQALGVNSVVIHPSYDPQTNDNDIALLMLSRNIQMGNNIPARAIPLARTLPPAGTMLTVTGYGTLTEGGDASRQLEMVQVPLVDLQTCRRDYYQENVTDNMLCAGLPQGGADACQGDSGGPLTYNGRLVGIVSWGQGCGERNYPGVYTDVTRYSNKHFLVNT